MPRHRFVPEEVARFYPEMKNKRELPDLSAAENGPAARPDSPDHDEWLMDEAIKETFPASDPPSPSLPGSSIAVRHQEEEQERRRGC